MKPEGGLVRPGRLYVIGEHEPERFVPARTGLPLPPPIPASRDKLGSGFSRRDMAIAIPAGIALVLVGYALLVGILSIGGPAT